MKFFFINFEILISYGRKTTINDCCQFTCDYRIFTHQFLEEHIDTFQHAFCRPFERKKRRDLITITITLMYVKKTIISQATFLLIHRSHEISQFKYSSSNQRIRQHAITMLEQSNCSETSKQLLPVCLTIVSE